MVTAANSKLVSGDVKRTVKDTKDVYVAIVLDEVSDSVMSVVEDADAARGNGVSVAYLGKCGKILRPLIDTLYGAGCSVRIIRGDILEDVLEPAPGLLSPGYFRHERMRRAISSFEIVRFASESASPRSTMT